ncbi:PRC-barrel domain-containing protein [Poseidonocella pacifica]|uniref:PRC-barrel domain-containing protein n=1 Tax=Poseidonocella pacifica TaxID=871651 RepID=A0A1I0Y404_9RHOB|nr:PRC-barrel domain-containing protein [Poseidonocella pacifica]SFB07436.1 PRC-barrel domain-containing protein [Poseidonocella pacifica]
MKRLLATTAIVFAASTPAFAESHAMEAETDAEVQAQTELGTEMNQAGEEIEQAADDAAAEIDQAAEDTAQAAENAGDEVEQMAQDGLETDTDATLNADANATAMNDSLFIGSASVNAGALSASELIGKYVYSSEAEVSGDAMAEADENWNNIGEVNDILMSADGKMQSVVLDIGGFLGMGEHTVAVSMDKLDIVQDSDDADDYFVVVKATKDELMAAPEFNKDDIGTNTAVEESETVTE